MQRLTKRLVILDLPNEAMYRIASNTSVDQPAHPSDRVPEGSRSHTQLVMSRLGGALVAQSGPDRWLPQSSRLAQLVNAAPHGSRNPSISPVLVHCSKPLIIVHALLLAQG